MTADWWSASVAVTPVFVTLAAALVAGCARGFSGFGAALIFMPVASAALGPRVAAPLMLIVDGIAALSLLPGAWRLADRRQVATLVAGAVLGIPCGAFVLTWVDPIVVRWSIAALVALMLAVLASGWRYASRLRPMQAAATGLVGGFFSGAAQMSGPVVMAFWLGGQLPGPAVRANAVLFFAAASVVTTVSYIVAALITGPVLLLSAVMTPVYALGLFGGARLFGRASERTFRRICYALIAAAAVISLPLLDRLLR